MLTPHIAIIDDEIDQLKEIQHAFFNAGYPCLPIHYMFDDLENASGIDHVEIKFNPRIIVTDLNLHNGTLGSSDSLKLVHPIYKLLERIDTKGPYILIFWSRIPEEVDSVMQLLQSRFYGKVNLPLYYTSINKADYLGGKNTSKLKEKIEEIINENNLANALLDWELRISQAASDTANSLFSITKPQEDEIEDNYYEIHTKNLENVLASIGNEAIGLDNAKKDPEAALDIGLYPVLSDHLSNSSLSSSSWTNAVPKIGEKITLDHKLKAKLNTFYHVDFVSEDYPKSCRGTFLKISNETLTNPIKKEKLEKRLGKNITEIIDEEFLYYYKSKQSELQEFRSKTILGFIEVSPECDQAQNKSKLHRYILSALTPIKSSTYEINLKKFSVAHSGIYKLPDLSIENNEFILQCSFKYQIGSIPEENSWFGKTHFRIRDQVMSDLIFNFAHHISRPGIICFR